jgi:hypothetical protein
MHFEGSKAYFTVQPGGLIVKSKATVVGIKQTLGIQQRQNSNASKSLALQGNHAHRFFPVVSVKIVEPSVQASNRKKNLHLLSSILQNLDIYPT